MTNDLTIIQPNTLAGREAGLYAAIQTWADATTDAASRRRADLLRDKKRALAGFFAWVDKPPDQVTAIDIKSWQGELEAQGKAQATVYAMISRISSFYEWALKSPELRLQLRFNPVTLARPKAPKAYQSDATQALDDSQAADLLRLVREKADSGDLVGKRDYALLLFYLLTGMRRQEIIGLRWGDLKLEGSGLILTARVKGGKKENREVNHPSVKAALFDYLQASGRRKGMTPSSPLWTRHDHAGDPGQPLTSHAFAANLKRYARQAGIGYIHLHQTRHTVARIVAEESGSLTATQDVLGHENLTTTKVYVQRIGLKRDKFSGAIADRLDV